MTISAELKAKLSIALFVDDPVILFCYYRSIQQISVPNILYETDLWIGDGSSDAS